jgi:hypothetical protein
MAPLWKWVIAGIALVLLGLGAFVFSVERYHRTGPPAQERQMRESAVQPLLHSHAKREDVVRTLGLPFEDYSIDSTNRWVLQQRVSIPRVRQAAERYPGVLFHTTAWTMTWLFFDAEGRLQDYYLCEQ